MKPSYCDRLPSSCPSNKPAREVDAIRVPAVRIRFIFSIAFNQIRLGTFFPSQQSFASQSGPLNNKGVSHVNVVGQVRPRNLRENLPRLVVPKKGGGLRP